MAYPKKRLASRAQTAVGSVKNTLYSPVMYTPGSTALDDVDWFVASADMHVGAYTLAHTAPDVGARNVTVSQTITNAAEDTNGTIVVVGTDLSGAAITETITPNGGATVAGALAFATVTSVTGAGWVINGADPDTITVGFGPLIGLPDRLTDQAQVLACSLANVREGTHPTVTVSATVLASNTVDPNSAHAGTAFKVYYVV